MSAANPSASPASFLKPAGCRHSLSPPGLSPAVSSTWKTLSPPHLPLSQVASLYLSSLGFNVTSSRKSCLIPLRLGSVPSCLPWDTGRLLDDREGAQVDTGNIMWRERDLSGPAPSWLISLSGVALSRPPPFPSQPVCVGFAGEGSCRSNSAFLLTFCLCTFP